MTIRPRGSASAPSPRGAIIIPVYNEENNVLKVIEDIRRIGIDWDIVAVDDGSTDRSRHLLEESGVHLVSHPINLGYGAAVQTGMKYAVRTGYETIVLMDSDGQHVPAEIPKLLQGLESGADIVIGSRLLGEPGGYPIPLLRRIGIAFFSHLAKLFAGIRIHDITSGFQAMRLPVAEFLAHEYPVDFPDAEVIISLGLRRFRIREVPCLVRQRESGTSMYSSPVRALYYPFKSFLASLIVLLRIARERS